MTPTTSGITAMMESRMSRLVASLSVSWSNLRGIDDSRAKKSCTCAPRGDEPWRGQTTEGGMNRRHHLARQSRSAVWLAWPLT
eukprot:5335473-Prymnesium_polylepis.1